MIPKLPPPKASYESRARVERAQTRRRHCLACRRQLLNRCIVRMYGGRRNTSAPACSIAAVTPEDRWGLRSVKHDDVVTHATPAPIPSSTYVCNAAVSVGGNAKRCWHPVQTQARRYGQRLQATSAPIRSHAH